MNIETALFEGVHPLHHFFCRIEGFFRFTGIQCGHIAGLQGGIRACSLPDLLTAGGKRLNRHIFHLPHAVFACHFRLIAEFLNERFEHLPVEFSEGYLICVHILDKARFTHRIGAKRLPLAAVLRRIDDHGMGVQLGLLIAVCVVIKFRHNEIAGQHGFAFSVRHDPGRRQRFHLFYGFCDGLIMGINQPLIPTDHGHDRHALRGGKGQVITWPVFVHAILHPGQVTAVRQLSFQQVSEHLLVHLPVKAQRLRALSLPAFIHRSDNVIVILVCIVIAGAPRRLYRTNRHHQKFPPISISSCSLRLWLILTSSRRCISRCICSPSSQAS